MKLNLKRQIVAVFVVTIMLCSTVIQGFAAGELSDYLNNLAEDVGYVYGYLDARDNSNILSVSNKMNSLTYNDLKASENFSEIDDLLDDLVDNNFVSKGGFSSKDAAKDAVVALVARSLGVYFVTDKASLKTALTNVSVGEKQILSTVETLFDVVESEKWFDLFLATRKDSADLWSVDDLWTWATGSTSDKASTNSLLAVFESLDNLLIKAIENRLAKAEYSEFKAGFENLGWTSAELVKLCRLISNYVDNNISEYALVKASARSAAYVVVDGAKLALVNSGADLNLKENIIRYTPESAPESLNLSLHMKLLDVHEKEWNVTNLIGYIPSENQLAYFNDRSEDDKINKVLTLNIDKTKKGTAIVVLKRDPLMILDDSADSDWLARFKIIVANEIGKVEFVDNEWDNGTVSWKAVPNASKYTVKLYKDGNLIETIENVETTDCNLNPLFVGSGDYTVTVQAFGDIPEEEGEVSEMSDEYHYESTIATVLPPQWKDNASTLIWDGVANATKYVVSLYKDDSATPFTTVTVDASEGVENAFSKDFSDDLDGVYGTIYATVQAKNETVAGAESAKSNPPLLLERIMTISGCVKLEAAKAGTTQADNSGIKVTIKNYEDSEKITYTDADGKFEFKDIKYNDGYVLWYESDCYMRGVTKLENSDESVVIDEKVLYYGELQVYGGTVINSADIAALISSLQALAGEEKYSLAKDINKDGIIDSDELVCLLRNIGVRPN